MVKVFGLAAGATLACLIFPGPESGLLMAQSIDQLAAPREPRVAELPDGFAEEVIASGITGGTGMAMAPDGRIFICEQTGALRVVHNDALLLDPVVTVEVDSAWERGLLGVALDPNFIGNQRLYLLYVSPNPYPHHRVSRFTLRGDSAISGSEVILLEGDDQTKLGGAIPAGHQGGGIHFGRDGSLYLAIGEQTAGSPSQRLDTFQGKLLRIRPDGTIPEDNPFYGSSSHGAPEGKYRAIWAYGLRNPFGFAIQPSTGRILINDVGSSRWEEINEGVAGANYGWPESEGPTTNPRHRSPIHAYGESPTQSISGGTFYEPDVKQFPPEYVGKYFFADFILNWIRVLDPVEPRAASRFARGLSGPVDLRVGCDGSLYCLNRNVWVKDDKFQPRTGTLCRISYTASSGRPAPVITSQPADVMVAVGDKAALSIEARGEGLRFQWEKDGRPVHDATSACMVLPAAAASDDGKADGGAEWRCVVANAHGAVLSKPCTVRVAALREPAAAFPTVPGLEYECHELSKAAAPALLPGTKVKSGVVESFSLSPRTRDERFGISFRGFLEVEKDGVYTFRLAAGGRTKLFVSSAEIAGTLMARGPRCVLGSIGLRAGRHPVRLDYSQGAGPPELKLTYSGPELEEAAIPPSKLSRVDRTALGAPAPPPGGPLERRELATTLSVPGRPEDLPPLLSETGVFLSLADLTPAPGLIPYEVNSPLWSDGALKRRWIALPGDSKIGFSSRGAWKFPAGTVLVKHFEIAGEGFSPQARRLETRLLVVDRSGKGYGATYRWRSDQREADLLEGALTEEVSLATGAGVQKRKWYYPSRSDCLVCHTAIAGFVLGVNTRQLNRETASSDPQLGPGRAARENQLRSWSRIGLLEPPLDGAAISKMARLVGVDDLSAPIEDRVRSYLDSNCSHCHRPGGARGEFDARFETPLESQKLIHGRLVAADLCVPDARVVTPGARSLSMVYLRMSRRQDVFNMPPLASFEVDREALALVGEWMDRMELVSRKQETEVQTGE